MNGELIKKLCCLNFPDFSFADTQHIFLWDAQFCAIYSWFKTDLWNIFKISDFKMAPRNPEQEKEVLEVSYFLVVSLKIRTEAKLYSLPSSVIFFGSPLLLIRAKTVFSFFFKSINWVYSIWNNAIFILFCCNKEETQFFSQWGYFSSSCFNLVPLCLFFSIIKKWWG